MPTLLQPLGAGFDEVARRRREQLMGAGAPTVNTGIDDFGLPNRIKNPNVGAAPPPVGSVAPVGTGGGGGDFVGVGTSPVGAGVPRWATWAPAVPKDIHSIVSEFQSQKGNTLSKDPQLPGNPLGSDTDSQYEAENAVLEQQINAAYQDILEQTGYDVDGKHIPGGVEQAAARKERDYLTGLTNASDEVTGQMQQAGTIFSGYHAGQRAKATQPFVTGLGDLAVDTPKTLAKLVESASDLMREYAVQRNLLIQQAAWRKQMLLLASQGVGGAGAAPPPPGGDQPYVVANPLPDLTWLNPTVTNAPYVDPTYNPQYGGDYMYPKKKKP